MMILTAFDGLCMAVADSVPGVSGVLLDLVDHEVGGLHRPGVEDPRPRRVGDICLGVFRDTRQIGKLRISLAAGNGNRAHGS